MKNTTVIINFTDSLQEGYYVMACAMWFLD